MTDAQHFTPREQPTGNEASVPPPAPAPPTGSPTHAAGSPAVGSPGAGATDSRITGSPRAGSTDSRISGATGSPDAGVTGSRATGSPGHSAETGFDHGAGHGSEHGPVLLAPDERDKLGLRLQHALSSFVESPRQAVEEADALFDETVRHLTETLTERRHTLRAGWQGHDTEAHTEELRLALRQYREATERLLRI
ncbi:MULTISPECIES: hypothetical protein [Streptomyces]